MGILKMRGIIALLAIGVVHAQDSGINQFYNVTRLISDGDKIRQDTLSYVRSVGDDVVQLSETVFPNGTFDATFETFDESQKFVFEQLDNGFKFVTDTIDLVADLMERACWTFVAQFEQYVEPWTGVDFCTTSYIENTTTSIDELSKRVEQWADTTDVWVLAFKYA